MNSGNCHVIAHRIALACLTAWLLPSCELRAQTQPPALYGLSAIYTNLNPVQGLFDTELDYAAYEYYDPRTDGFLTRGGTIVVQQTDFVHPYAAPCPIQQLSGPPPYGYVCSFFFLTDPSARVPATTYQAQTNHWIRAYFTEVVNSTIVYEDPDGFSFTVPENDGGDATVIPDDDSTTTVSEDYYQATTYIAAVSEAPPSISGIQVNGVQTDTIIAGSSGYMSIYGTNLDGTASVSASGTGIAISSFQVYGSTQVNAFFAASPQAGGQHNVSIISSHGSSAANAASSVTGSVITVTQVVFQQSVGYSRDFAGGAAVIGTPTWNSSTSDAAVYVSGNKMAANVSFSLSPAPSKPVPGVRIQGLVPGVGNLVATGATIPASSSFTVSTTADTAFPASQTKFLNPMQVTWDVSPNGAVCGTGCADAGVSSNKVYVTLATPTLPSQAGPLMLTYVMFAVANGGATSQAQAIANTWNMFAGPANIKTWDGRLLYYYKPGVGFNGCALNAAELVEGTTGGSGQCGSFALLLESSLAANGIHSSWIQIQATDGSGMVVRDWTFAGTPTYPQYTPFIYKMILNNSNDAMVPARSNYGDLANLSTLYGQNTAPPSEKVFGLHFIVQIPGASGDQYFDPSYGVQYLSPADFESKAIAGYAVSLDTADGTGIDYKVRKPAAPANITFTPVSKNSM